MEYSIVNYITVKENSDFRIDAEYYHPVNLKNDKLLQKFNSFYFKDIADIKFGTTPSGANFLEKGIPFIRSQDFPNGFIDDANAVFISEEDHLKQKKSGLQNKDVLIAAVGATIGKIAFCLNMKDGNINQNIARLRLKDKNIFPEFLFVFMLSKFGQYQLGKLNTGNAQSYLNSQNIASLSIIELKYDFQELIKRIVIKSHFFITQSKDFYFQAEQLLLLELGLLNWKSKQELAFVKNFSDTQKSDRFDAEYFQPKYEEIIEAVKRYKGGSNELGNLVKIRKSIEPGSEAYQESGIAFVRVSNLSKFELSNNNQQFISEKLYDGLKNYQPKKDEILLSKDATPGIAYYLNEEPNQMIVSGGILRLKIVSHQILPEYLTLILNSIVVQKQIERDVGGSVINHWRPDQIKATKIPILKNTKQKEIKKLIKKSFFNRKQSKSLLEIAKRGVEIAIEKTEEEAQKWIYFELNKIGINLSIKKKQR